ncbi:FhaA domain-containing protein [Demequina mangrovi]|uniref:Inner membrane component of T3SS domain-containing protein n=1 Tax=Demequina mangrovi TaxID=1043493 RepID=A0A1H6ZSY2_9MICO|nr:DUF3662 and FHA domain-containing protein [Demequina mangrovi]SEJ56623.1 Inner membrane component of T3SS domain-containing protein [Demequina mangrovi]
MGVLDRFERGVENVMQNAFARTFKAGVKPVELAAAVKRECDARAAVVDRGRTVAPNEYVIALAPADMETIDQWGEDALRHELIDSLRSHAERQRYSFVGAVEVALEEDETLATGRYAVVSRTTRGPVAPATGSNPSSRYPLLDIDGVRYYLTGESTTIGRGTEADIVVDDTGVSRRHVRLEVTDHGTILTDLGSTNGTFVEDQRVGEATLLDGNAITIGRTSIMYWDAVAGNEDV